MDAVKGTCSICGGDVVGHVGPWHAVIPPPPARCTQCGATEARGPVIPMVPTLPMQPQKVESVDVTIGGRYQYVKDQQQKAGGAE